MDTSPAAIAARMRDALAFKAKYSKRQLEKDSGLSKGYASRLTSEDGYGEVSAAQLAAIARALGVNFNWLATGEGPMVGNVDDAETFERYPNFVEAASMAHKMGIDSAAVREVHGEVYALKEDPSVAEWYERIRAVADRRRDAAEPARAETRAAQADEQIAEKQKSRPKWGKR